MSVTPLSDLITTLLASSDQATFAKFDDLFLRSQVGVVASGLPTNRCHGEGFRVGEHDRVTLELVETPDGRAMIKACADPEVFCRRYPDTKITALMLGRDVLETMLTDPMIDGVLVCSAMSFHSIPIGKADAQRLVAASATRAPSPKPWWKFWGS